MTPAITKNAFVTGAATPPKPAGPQPKANQAIKFLDDLEAHLRLYNWGLSGSGKTFLLAVLAEAGYKILITDSDVGGSGHNTILSYLKAKGKFELRKNIARLPIPSYDAAESFLENPAAYWKANAPGQPALWEWNPEIVAWEGFGNFQQIHIWDKAVSLTGGKTNKDGSDYDGLALATMDWGLVQKATHQCIDSFCRIQNPFTGFTPHKIYQAHVDDRAVDMEGRKVAIEKINSTQTQAGSKPWLLGQGAKLVLGACDYGWRCFSKETATLNKDGSKSAQVLYGYDFTPGERNGGKTRDFGTLTGWPVILPVKPLDVFNEMLASIGLTPKDPIK